MSQEEDADDKPHDPSQNKLNEARKRGEIVISQDALAAIGLTVIFLGMTMLGNGTLWHILADLKSYFRLAFDSTRPGAPSDPGVEFLPLFRSARRVLVPLILLPAVAVIAALIATNRIKFTGSNIALRFDRLSLISNAKKKFSGKALADFARKLAVLAALSVVLYITLSQAHGLVRQTAWMAPGAISITVFSAVLALWGKATAISIVAGIADLFLQIFRFRQKHRMSGKEMKDEQKESEGDPDVRQKRRAQAEKFASSQMMAAVPKSSVVIVNPEHYAVALSWSEDSPGAPKCVAKGVDDLALAIRRVARSKGVPIFRDPPTARALFRDVEIGKEIEPIHFRAVAIAINFAWKHRKPAPRT